MTGETELIFDPDEDAYFTSVFNDPEKQETFKRFLAWKNKKHPPAKPTSNGSEGETKPTTPAPKDWTIKELRELASEKSSRSILKSFLAEMEELEAAELLRNENPAGPKANPAPAKKPDPKPDPLTDLAKKVKKFI